MFQFEAGPLAIAAGIFQKINKKSAHVQTLIQSLCLYAAAAAAQETLKLFYFKWFCCLCN